MPDDGIGSDDPCEHCLGDGCFMCAGGTAVERGLGEDMLSGWVPIERAHYAEAATELAERIVRRVATGAEIENRYGEWCWWPGEGDEEDWVPLPDDEAEVLARLAGHRYVSGNESYVSDTYTPEPWTPEYHPGAGVKDDRPDYLRTPLACSVCGQEMPCECAQKRSAENEARRQFWAQAAAEHSTVGGPTRLTLWLKRWWPALIPYAIFGALIAHLWTRT